VGPLPHIHWIEEDWEWRFEMNIQDLKRISDIEWEIPKSYRQDMRGPVRLFATREILEKIMGDKSLEQAVNATTLPGLVGAVVVMPDMHQGYGFPIGGVAATEYPHGVISPGAIGYDINCGVRLLASGIEYENAQKDIDTLAELLKHYCPSGVGKAGVLKVSLPELDKILSDGSRWALRNGYTTEADLARTEESGSLAGNPGAVSDRAKKRGREQVGSLGAGNHFIEVDLIEQIFDARAAATMGLQAGCLAVQIHCGSRGLGHQVCTDYVGSFQNAVRKYNIQLPDRELVCAPMNSPEGQAYLGAMRAAANFAFVNRGLLAHSARRAFEEALGGRATNWHLHQVYDIAHNMGKIETHMVAGKSIKVCVHRKGATRAFGPGAQGLPSEYQAIGQPVIIPGSMGTASWVLAGTKTSMQRTFGSSCHGAGRVMSRSKARKEVRGEDLYRDLKKQGIVIKAGSMSGLAEEAPLAYKDVDSVVETVASAGIARKVARLRPLIVIKG
jgi:tRNA-splicing ligase RtcB (3'-phosphate/5'-hydroxy nucleic acid ligase)